MIIMSMKTKTVAVWLAYITRLPFILCERVRDELAVYVDVGLSDSARQTTRQGCLENAEAILLIGWHFVI